MKRLPLTAAIKRLRAYTDWDGDTSPNPYNDSSHSMRDDLKLVLRAIDVLDRAEHVGDSDMMPIFELQPDCSWKNADKGLLHCIGMELVNEDAPDGAYFQ